MLAGGRAVGRLGTVVDHVDLGPIALALVKRGLPADIELTTGGESEVAAAIDPDSLPDTDARGRRAARRGTTSGPIALNPNGPAVVAGPGLPARSRRAR